jgi:hypothetical protein
MGALYETPELFKTYAKVARSYKLPFLHFIERPSPEVVATLAPSDVVADAVIMRLQNGSPAEWRQYYLNAIRTLKPGLTVILVHLGYDDAELRAVTVGWDDWGAAWRQRDYDVLTSAEFQRALKENGVVMVTWREVREMMYPGATP